MPVNRSFWRSYRFAVALVTAAAVYASFTPALQRLEWQLPYWAAYFMPEGEPVRSVATVGIDQRTLEVQGPWPWRHDTLATVIERLAQFEPKAIGVMVPLADAQTDPALADVRGAIADLDADLQPQARQWIRRLDADARLAGTIARAANLVLAAHYEPSAGRGESAVPAPGVPALRHLDPGAWAAALRNRVFSAPAQPRVEIHKPLPRFGEAAKASGALHTHRQAQAVYGVPMVVETAGGFLPAFELALFMAVKQLPANALRVGRRDTHLQPGDGAAPVFSRYAIPRPSAPVAAYSLEAILSDDDRAGRALRGKTVLLGLSAPGLAPRLAAPGGRAYSPLGWSAHLLASLLNQGLVHQPPWFFAAERGLLLLAGLYLVLLPASWRGRRGLLLGALLALVLVNSGAIALLVHNLWLPVMAPAAFVVLLQGATYLLWSRQQRLSGLSRDLTAARLALGANLQSQGQLDNAGQQYLRCLPDRATLAPLYELGLEYERRRQLGRARAVYERLCAVDRRYRDAAARCERLGSLAQRFPSAGGSVGGGQTLMLDTPVVELPVLGRYRLERELGHGAMGSVYLARDPTIGRDVAIKTLPLAAEHDDPEQAAIAERFLREAEAVGRLDHPNIVHVHDAGREHDLAYIAMDYVAGETLAAWTDKNALLPVWEVLEVIADVAAALDYAHQRKVVHRDIKPGNILYDRDSGVVKITDFGVARILDASCTRTGTVLGSPSYMSPEQIAGKKTDGRSDLFSLGVTLYQLLTGELPYRGDSLATLMYQIANEKTPAVRKVRRGLPVCIGRLVAKALNKEPAKRYGCGGAMATAVLNCRAQFKGGRRKSA